MENVKLIRVPALGVPTYWDEVKKLLEETRDTWSKAHTIESMFYLLVNDKLQLWILLDELNELQMAGFTEFRTYPKGKVISCVWLAGKGLQDHLELIIDRIEEYGWMTGASYAVIEGRPAFQKLFAPKGYEHLSTTICKELARGRTH